MVYLLRALGIRVVGLGNFVTTVYVFLCACGCLSALRLQSGLLTHPALCSARRGGSIMSGSLKPATEQLIATLNKSNQDQGGQGGQGVNASHLVDVPKTRFRRRSSSASRRRRRTLAAEDKLHRSCNIQQKHTKTA